MLFSALLTALLLLLPLSASAGSSKAVEKEINAFKQSGMHRFAPQTISRADAYLGAAMLADSEQKLEESASAQQKAIEMLMEAKATAAGFRDSYRDLLQLRKEAGRVVEIVANAPQLANNLNAKQQFDAAEGILNEVITTRENGELNRTAESAAAAKAAYHEVLRNALPQLSELAASLISSASAKGAKMYAPTTYQAAKEKLAEVRSYVDGIVATPPRNPGDAYYLAVESKLVAEQVKQWRKRGGSHEKNLIRSRDFRQQLAQALAIETSDNVLLVNTSAKDLLHAVKALNAELIAERKRRSDDAVRLKLEFDAELERRLTLQTDELKQAQHSQLTDMKEAFRAKLERETFEKKRQARIRSQFVKGDADIFVNLDGSLLIRLNGLKFPPGRSKLDPKSYDLMGRLKAALEVYADRSVRIEGHTDNLGDVKPNQQLSLKRAESVRDFLIAAGTAGGRLKALGYGEVRPIASNEFPQGRAMNRRIDIVINAAK